uniref:Uncharacterized protein n=1 Tax=Peronospora matthiolae TaxID=2874970 RepID=A0AAV1TM91_9STRA
MLQLVVLSRELGTSTGQLRRRVGNARKSDSSQASNSSQASDATRLHLLQELLVQNGICLHLLQELQHKHQCLHSRRSTVVRGADNSEHVCRQRLRSCCAVRSPWHCCCYKTGQDLFTIGFGFQVCATRVARASWPVLIIGLSPIMASSSSPAAARASACMDYGYDDLKYGMPDSDSLEFSVDEPTGVDVGERSDSFRTPTAPASKTRVPVQELRPTLKAPVHDEFDLT